MLATMCGEIREQVTTRAIGRLNNNAVRATQEQARQAIYDFLAALLSHPNEGKWGRVLNPQIQRSVIRAADLLRETAFEQAYPLREGELDARQIDLRCLVLELCQPFEHLRAEYERVLQGPQRARSGLAHELGEAVEGESPSFTGAFQELGALDEEMIPARPGDLAYEFEFMNCLLKQHRIALRLAEVDSRMEGYASRCDLAQERFFGDHLADWVVSFASRLRACPSGGYLEPLGRFLAAWIPLERFRLGQSGLS